MLSDILHVLRQTDIAAPHLRHSCDAMRCAGSHLRNIPSGSIASHRIAASQPRNDPRPSDFPLPDGSHAAVTGKDRDTCRRARNRGASHPLVWEQLECVVAQRVAGKRRFLPLCGGSADAVCLSCYARMDGGGRKCGDGWGSVGECGDGLGLKLGFLQMTFVVRRSGKGHACQMFRSVDYRTGPGTALSAKGCSKCRAGRMRQDTYCTFDARKPGSRTGIVSSSSTIPALH